MGNVHLRPVGFIAVALLLAACTTWAPDEPSLGGWPLGEAVDCASLTSTDPAFDQPAIARANLDAGGKDVVAVECHREGRYLRNGSRIQIRSGSVIVLVFTLNDGSRKAVGVFCGVMCSPTSPSRARRLTSPVGFRSGPLILFGDPARRTTVGEGAEALLRLLGLALRGDDPGRVPLRRAVGQAADLAHDRLGGPGGRRARRQQVADRGRRPRRPGPPRPPRPRGPARSAGRAARRTGGRPGRGHGRGSRRSWR